MLTIQDMRSPPLDTPVRVSAHFLKTHYPVLAGALDRLREWFAVPDETGVNGVSAQSYMTTVRATLANVLVSRLPLDRAWARLPQSTAAAAWRYFFAFIRRGGNIQLNLNAPPEPYRLDLAYLNDVMPVLDLIQNRSTTAPGSVMEPYGVGVCVRALWGLARPHVFHTLLLSEVMRRRPDGLYAPVTVEDDPTSRFATGTPAQRTAMAYLALWSYAGATPTEPDLPILLAVPRAAANTKQAAMTAKGPVSAAMWDLASRPPRALPPMPPEGNALLAGEAIDLAMVAPLFPPEDPGVPRLYAMVSPRWSGRGPITPDEVRHEEEVLAAFWQGPAPLPEPAPEPAQRPGWSLVVNVAGVGDEPDASPPDPAVDHGGESSRSVSEIHPTAILSHSQESDPDFDQPELPT